ncbi:MAG TPA: prephenate dehydrogenase/arogenate dehydrogenase family protein, partial [Hyphomicrobiaceae bacterium]
MTKPLFDTVALIGIGLIGSSISHGIRRGGLARRVTGYAKTEATRSTARRLGLVDEVFNSAAGAADGADLVILCVPVGA